MIGEVLYSAQDAHMWLLDSGATFHVTPNIEWFLNYSAKASGTIRLGNGQQCKIARTGEVPICELDFCSQGKTMTNTQDAKVYKNKA